MENKAHIINTVVVEDEKLSRETLISHIREYCPALHVVAECRSVREACRAISLNEPQLVFLDIELPGGDGFELLKKFRKIEFCVIFITAYSEYATKAFRFSATDFLLKPVKISELIEAVEKAKQNLRYKDFTNLETLLENLDNQSGHFQKLIIPNQKGFVAVNSDEIIMCRAEGYCTNFFLIGGRKIISSHNLKYYEELLPARMFMRIHNSFIINLLHVKGYSNQGEISLDGDLFAPLSRNHREEFFLCWNKGKK
ncbi:MAG TPA: LytTR family DNA-binding domain-containing protein [Bacteroidales bacterium]|nr:response regulator transcription factor [Bacteroidales bacterium]HPJ60878.1 LytTR family DNA-binding domain-containing protein [Bacteroidales bacterium]HPR13636.1 LytTR family DNA-binding domain-containing protein [Bacteroidales bacterium]